MPAHEFEFRRNGTLIMRNPKGLNGFVEIYRPRTDKWEDFDDPSMPEMWLEGYVIDDVKAAIRDLRDLLN